ncbi:acetyl/propionyl-CoA carboxylase, alpha subunit [Desulfoscipio gibsoniae DSM 7213]|uniref:Acetyl/propionyl-CoA carboxylase, alpha subunit n=2 Tax=Desulfoscipio gibsoniae TaxID=102134 RepID=R4KBC8_9FIRM|nr:acetyl/propionyl-CoA carboxylase, alpha subunit [Desulfoscipio gibsoniae DSM 7213]
MEKEGNKMIGSVLSPMPGIITEIFVQVGDKVNTEDELMILEAMKMENPIVAPVPGTVLEIKVAVQEHVQSDQVLVVIK